MKRIALLLWGLVLGLALLIWWQEQSARPVSAQAWLDRPLSLLRPAGAVLPEGARPEPVVADSPVKRVVPPAPAPVATGCSRLGLFPGRGWASEVAEKLAAASGDEPAVAWTLLPAGSRGFYIVFPDMGMEGLAGRMVARRVMVSRLLSAAAVPEACR